MTGSYPWDSNQPSLISLSPDGLVVAIAQVFYQNRPEFLKKNHPELLTLSFWIAHKKSFLKNSVKGIQPIFVDLQYWCMILSLFLRTKTWHSSLQQQGNAQVACFSQKVNNFKHISKISTKWLHRENEWATHRGSDFHDLWLEQRFSHHCRRQARQVRELFIGSWQLRAL